MSGTVSLILGPPTADIEGGPAPISGSLSEALGGIALATAGGLSADSGGTSLLLPSVLPASVGVVYGAASGGVSKTLAAAVPLVFGVVPPTTTAANSWEITDQQVVQPPVTGTTLQWATQQIQTLATTVHQMRSGMGQVVTTAPANPLDGWIRFAKGPWATALGGDPNTGLLVVYYGAAWHKITTV